MHLDKQHPRPVYLQLKEVLQNKIEQGIYLSHQQLPSERDLCQQYNLSRMTARRALQALIAEGLAYTRAGKGTFVSHYTSNSGTAKTDNLDKNGRLGLSNITLDVEYREKLLDPLLTFNCAGAERAINEALADHSLETVAGKLLLDTICYLEQLWQKGEINLLVHNYAITTLHSKLTSMMNAATMSETGPRVLLACTPQDLHDMGLLLLALSLRRRGFIVIYMGPNLATDELHQVIEMVNPRLVCLSAATEQAANNLTKLGRQFFNKTNGAANNGAHNSQQKPFFVFGGVAFSRNPAIVSDIPGYYLGHTIENAVIKIQELLVK